MQGGQAWWGVAGGRGRWGLEQWRGFLGVVCGEEACTCEHSPCPHMRTHFCHPAHPHRTPRPRSPRAAAAPQTCFLSSVDIHTHCGYQTMLEESIAIVMAPTDRNKKFAVFRLTTPGGLSLIQKCPLRGFHAHPPTDTGQDIYELCGHVYLNERLRHDVVDLR